MLTHESIRDLADEIASLGYDERTAWRFAALVGDTPIVGPDNRVLVMDEAGRELARLAIKCFDE